MSILITQLIEHFGTQEKTAKALGVSQPTVSGWVRGLHGVSELHALKIEKITEGKLKAVELCPRLAALDAA